MPKAKLGIGTSALRMRKGRCRKVDSAVVNMLWLLIRSTLKK